MQDLHEPSSRKLAKFLAKNPLTDSTILHWTGSMWGIGCRLSSNLALDRIRKLKQRPEKQGMIALIPEINMLNSELIPSALKPLIQQYLPGNLTMVISYKEDQFEPIAVNGKMAFRIPGDPLLREFIAQLGEPMISTSINLSGLPPEEDLAKIKRNFQQWFDFALLPSSKVAKEATKQSTIIEYIRANEMGGNGHTDELKCLREGSIPFYEIKQSFKMPLVMFVCTANVCRSPIAEKLFREMLTKGNVAMVTDSCGLIDGGRMITDKSMQLLLERGIMDAPSHISKQATPQMISSSWLVLTMEEGHRNWLREQNPNSANKIYTLNEIVGEKGDVEDPYGGVIEDYRITFSLIEDRLKRLMQMINTNTLRFSAPIS